MRHLSDDAYIDMQSDEHTVHVDVPKVESTKTLAAFVVRYFVTVGVWYVENCAFLPANHLATS